MDPLVLTPAEKTAAMELGASDLKFLIEKHGVHEDLQAGLYHVGVRTIPVLATLASTTAELKDIVKDEFGVDAAAGILERVKVANLLVAWEVATTRTKKQSEIEGELQSRHLVKPMASSEYAGMVASWERKYWQLDEDVIPARSYL